MAAAHGARPATGAPTPDARARVFRATDLARSGGAFARVAGGRPPLLLLSRPGPPAGLGQDARALIDDTAAPGGAAA